MIKFHETSARGDLCANAAALHNLCFPKAWSPRDITDLLTKPGAGLFEDVNLSVAPQMHGFILYRQAGGEAEILTLCVAPDERRSGVARRLVRAMTDHLEQSGIEDVFLEVEKTNLPAYQLYETCGFIKAGYRRDYYGAGRHAVVMRFAESFEAAS